MAQLGRAIRFGLGRREPAIDAHHSHAFVPDSLGRSGLAASSLYGGGRGQLAPLALTDASVRAGTCALADCGKPREDPIHSPPEV